MPRYKFTIESHAYLIPGLDERQSDRFILST